MTKEIIAASAANQTSRQPDNDIVERLVQLASESVYVRELLDWANEKLVD